MPVSFGVIIECISGAEVETARGAGDFLLALILVSAVHVMESKALTTLSTHMSLLAMDCMVVLWKRGGRERKGKREEAMGAGIEACRERVREGGGGERQREI